MLLVEVKSSAASAALDIEASCRSVVEDGAERFLVPEDLGEDPPIFFWESTPPPPSTFTEGTEILVTTGAVAVAVVGIVSGGPVAEDCAAIGRCSGCC
jgi:hypothetical protein